MKGSGSFVNTNTMYSYSNLVKLVMKEKINK